MKFRPDMIRVRMDAATDAPPAGGVAAPAAPAPTAAAPTTPPASAPAAVESLLRTDAPAAPPAASPSGEPAQPGAAEFDYIPEKYRVAGADGKVDLAASAKKLADGYSAAAKRIGTGDLPPETAAAYTFKVPDELKDAPVEEVLGPFRERAHKAGLTQAQFEFVAGEYFELVPQMLNGAAKLSADQARAELQQVWTSKADYEANLTASQRAVATLPAPLQEQVHGKLGTDPVFLQVMAILGGEMREGSPPSNSPAGASAGTLEQIMSSEAYRNPAHPEHKAVSERAQAMAMRLHGTAPII